MLFTTNNTSVPFLEKRDFLSNLTAKDIQPSIVYQEDNDYIIEVPRCCENCPNRPTKDNPARICWCAAPTLGQVTY